MTLLSGVVEPTTWRLEGGQKEYRWETEQIDWTTSEEQESANPRIIEQSTSTRNTIIYRFQTSINVQFRQRVQQGQDRETFIKHGLLHHHRSWNWRASGSSRMTKRCFNEVEGKESTEHGKHQWFEYRKRIGILSEGSKTIGTGI